MIREIRNTRSKRRDTCYEKGKNTRNENESLFKLPFWGLSDEIWSKFHKKKREREYI